MSGWVSGERWSSHALTWLAAAAGIFTAGVVISGCSLAPQERRTIRIEIPRNPAIQKLNASPADPLVAILSSNYAALGSYAPTPTGLGGIGCIGISVSGEGIANDDRLSSQCKTRDGSPFGIFAGLVSAVDGGVLEFSVLSGAARKVRVFGMSLAPGFGCPTMESVLQKVAASGVNDPKIDELGDPYILSEKVIDIFADTEITMDAFFDPGRLMLSCQGDGNGSIPLVMARKGRYISTLGSVPPAPTGPEGDGSFFGEPTSMDPWGRPVELTAAEKALALDFIPSQSGTSLVATAGDSVFHNFTGAIIDGVAQNGRATMRFAFDATGWENLPYMKVRLRYSGGKAGCTSNTSNTCGMAWAYVSTNTVANWENFGKSYGNSYLYWSSYSTRTAPHVVKFADEKPYVLIDVESDTFSTDVLASQVIVEGISVRLSALPEALQAQLGSGMATSVPAGQPIHVYARGGVSPYTWTMIIPGTTTPITGTCTSVDCSNAHFSPQSQVGGIYKITVKDSELNSYSFDITLTPAIATRLQVPNSTPVDAGVGTCNPLLVISADNVGTQMVTAADLTADLGFAATSASFVAGTFYANSGCTAGSEITRVTVPANSDSMQIFFKLDPGSIAGASYSITFTSLPGSYPFFSSSASGIVGGGASVGTDPTQGETLYFQPPKALIVGDPCYETFTVQGFLNTPKDILVSSSASGRIFGTQQECLDDGTVTISGWSAVDQAFTRSFWFKPDLPGRQTFTAKTLDGVLQSQIVVDYLPGAQLRFSMPASPVLYLNECAHFLVELVDPLGQAVTNHPAIPLKLIEGNGSTGKFYPSYDSTCSGPGFFADVNRVLGSLISIPDGSSSVWFFYRPQSLTDGYGTTQFNVAPEVNTDLAGAQVNPSLASRQSFLLHTGPSGSFAFAEAASNLIPTAIVGMTSSSATPVNFNFGNYAVNSSTTNNYGYLSYEPNPKWYLGVSPSDDFTIEMWVKLSITGPPSPGMPVTLIGTSDWVLVVEQMGLGFRFNKSGAFTTTLSQGSSFWATDLSAWHHVAVTRSGLDCKLFLDGAVVASGSGSGPCASTNASGDSGVLYLGSHQGISGAQFPVDSAFDEVRIMKGVALWNSSFTPPLYPY